MRRRAKSLAFLLRLVAARASLDGPPGWRLGVGEDAGTLTAIRAFLWNCMTEPCVIGWLDAVRICLYPRNEISRSILMTGRFEPNEFRWLSGIIRPGMTFIDVGANMGLYTLFVSRQVGPSGVVLSIEPSTREIERLRKHLEINGLTNVRIRQVAVSDRRSETDLLIATEEKSGHNTLGKFGYTTVSLQGRERVQTERLDDVVAEERIDKVDIMKMDIEGGELHALKGAGSTLERHCPMILLELSDRTLQHQGSSSREIWDVLEQRGYIIHSFDLQTGFPVPADRKEYYDGENIIALLPQHRCLLS